MSNPKPITITLHHCLAKGEHQLDCQYLENDQKVGEVVATLDEQGLPVEVLASQGGGTVFVAANKLAGLKLPGKLRPAIIRFHQPNAVNLARDHQSQLFTEVMAALDKVIARPADYQVSLFKEDLPFIPLYFKAKPLMAVSSQMLMTDLMLFETGEARLGGKLFPAPWSDVVTFSPEQMVKLRAKITAIQTAYGKASKTIPVQSYQLTPN